MRLRGWETIGPSDRVRPVETTTTSSGRSSVTSAGTCTNAPSARNAVLSAANALSGQLAARVRPQRVAEAPRPRTAHQVRRRREGRGVTPVHEDDARARPDAQA